MMDTIIKYIKVAIKVVGKSLIAIPLLLIALTAIWFVLTGRLLFTFTELDVLRLAVAFIIGLVLAMLTEGFQV